MLVEADELVIAARVDPGTGQRYAVAWCGDHDTLEPGDVVVMVEDERRNNVFIRQTDETVHSLMGDWGYVILSPIR